MSWQAYVQPQALPEYVAAVAMVALALWLVWLDVRRLANVSFALFLIVRAAATVSFTLEQLARKAGDVATEWRAEHARAAFTIATVVSLMLFVLVYPRTRSRRAIVGLAILFGLLEAAYWVWPSLWATYTIRDDVLVQVTIGPFYVFQLLRVPAFAAAAVLFARDWVRTRSGPTASALLLVALAFALHATYDAANSALFYARHASEVGAWLQAELVLDVLSIVPVAAAALWIAVRSRRRSAHERSMAAKALIALPLPILTLGAVYALHVFGFDAAGEAANLFFLGLWRLSLPLLATYALVRFGLFELEVRMKRSIQRVVVAVLFVLVFFAVSEGAENLLGGTGSVYGLLAAILLALLLTPLERVADRIADAAMPDVASVHELGRHERRLLYTALARSAWSSGRVSPDERKLLDVARGHLGIEAKQAERIESELAAHRARPRNPRRDRRP